jgi:hypothetical protein
MLYVGEISLNCLSLQSTLHYITLHYITLHYITLHYITLHYITLHYITLHYITLRHYLTKKSCYESRAIKVTRFGRIFADWEIVLFGQFF